MTNVVDLADRRSDEWWSSKACCWNCRSEFVAVVPLPMGRAEQKRLKCDGCGESGGVFFPEYELVGAFVVYDTPDAEPRKFEVDEDDD